MITPGGFMSNRIITFLSLLIILPAASVFVHAQCFSCSDAPPGTIWCDDFEDGIPMQQKYFEFSDNDGDFAVLPFVGRDSTHGIRIIWQPGEISAGGMKKSFGRTPSAYIGKYSAYPDSSFDEIYWRIDVKLTEGWIGGGPAKLSRALCIANENWATGMMAHLWSGGKDNLFLGMDPASGISKEGLLAATKYNDFDNLRWLGWKPGITDIYNSVNSGKWYCIEGHVKLNTPGQSDGIFEFSIDDTLQAGTYNLNWHGTWNSNQDNFKINAVFFENYWNSGSPVLQERYFDNIVISTKRIGCGCKSTSAVEEERNTVDVPGIYPNPVLDFLTVDSSQINTVVLYNIFGAKIECGSNTEGSKTVIDMRDAGPGVYYLVGNGGKCYRIIKL